MTGSDTNTGTVTVSFIPDYENTVYMNWAYNPVEADARAAFGTILEILDQVDNPVNIIVNVKMKPTFPLVATIQGAKQLQTHPMMGQWLVVGKNGLARIIAHSISAVSRNNIEWFDGDAEAMARLDKLCETHKALSV